MRFRTTCIAIAAFGFVALSMASQALAQAHEGGWGRGGIGFLRGVNLSDDQKAKVHQIQTASWEQTKPLIEQLRQVHKQLASQLLGPGSVTAAQLQPLVQQEEQLRSKLNAQRLERTLEVRALLTPEQLAQAGSVHAREQLHDQERSLLRTSSPPGGAEPK
jgi:Spy/CpxP family protein refolding chaperone